MFTTTAVANVSAVALAIRAMGYTAVLAETWQHRLGDPSAVRYWSRTVRRCHPVIANGEPAALGARNDNAKQPHSESELRKLIDLQVMGLETIFHGERARKRPIDRRVDY